MRDEPIGSWEDFWPFYLGEHRVPLCRVLHVAGTTSGGSLALLGLLTGEGGLFLLALMIGYGFSWVGHFLVERNRPATFSHPLWSFRGDWKMVVLFWTRRLDGEVVRLFGDRHPTLAAVAARRTKG